MYFSNFPLVRYNGELQVNITRRAGIANQFKSNPAYYVEYTIQESDTPEIIADKIYDDASLAWIVLDMNTIVNVFEEWPKSQQALEAYVKYKYADPYGVAYYISGASGIVVDPLVNPAWDNIPVTHYEHEHKLNEAKRNIRLLLPDYVGAITSRHKELMRV